MRGDVAVAAAVAVGTMPLYSEASEGAVAILLIGEVGTGAAAAVGVTGFVCCGV